MISLLEWCDRYKINLIDHGEFIFEVKDVGRFVLVKDKNDHLFDDKINFLLDDREYNLIENSDRNGIKYIVFCFGDRFYYSGIKKASIIQEGDVVGYSYSVEFNDFLYLGTIKQGIEIEYSCLAVHSEYELLNSALNVTNVIKKMKFLGVKNLSICDKNTLAGTLYFQSECSKYKINSITGETIIVRDFVDDFKVKLYVTSEIGWKSLLMINKIINVDNAGKFISKQDLFENSKDLICVFDYKDSPISRTNDASKAIGIIKSYKKAFHSVYQQISVVEYKSRRTDIKCLENMKFFINEVYPFIGLVYIDDIYFLESEFSDIKKTLNFVGQITDDASDDFYPKSSEEVVSKMMQLFDAEKQFDDKEALDIILESLMNTNEIADLCSGFNIETGVQKLPKYDTPDGIASSQFLMDLLEKGFDKKVIGKVSEDKYEEYWIRAIREYDLIAGANLSDYFLILWDIVDWAKRQDILVGVGRGSVGGSLLCHLLEITNLDPIKYDLLFERFLNPARLRSPDVFSFEMVDGSVVSFIEDELLTTSRGRLRAKEIIESDEIFL